MMHDALRTSTTEEWETPAALFHAVQAEFALEIDVCASDNNAKLPHFWTREDDALAQQWAPRRCWMNPPYGRRIYLWVRKASQEAARGALIVGLIPARTETDWWCTWVLNASEIRFIPRRLRFSQWQTGAPFPSAVVIWRPDRTPDSPPHIRWWRVDHRATTLPAPAEK